MDPVDAARPFTGRELARSEARGELEPAAGGAAPSGPEPEPGEGLAAEAVVALCQVLNAAQYAEFMGELDAAPDAAHTAAVVRRWAARVRSGAGRRRGASRGADSGPAAPAG